MSWYQKIYFGTPGTGKSHKVHKEVIPNELKIEDDSNIISTVFHPEYSYGDFMGKLLPITNERKEVEYNYYEGFFLKALAKAYKNILNNEENQNVVLVIDEINRGNSSAIFGTIFQLLDRDENGWSSYDINISDMEFKKLVCKVFDNLQDDIENLKEIREEIREEKAINNKIDKIGDSQLKNLLSNKQIKIPPNFFIIGTMNTSDESIYYMDSAFKRRWDWEYVENNKSNEIENIRVDEFSLKWVDFIDALNDFLIKHSENIRGIEDKQIGYWFIKTNELTIPIEKIKNKLMFYLWDSVFSRDKEPLNELLSLENENKLKTFGEFQTKEKEFIEVITNKSLETYVIIPPRDNI